MRLCTIENCGKTHHAKGLCLSHYHQSRYQYKGRMRGSCKVGDCSKPHTAKGMCVMHYYREWRKNHKGAYKERIKRYRQKNPEKFRRGSKAYAKKNPKKIQAWNLARRKRVQKHTPPWADLKVIRNFYFNCPQGYHVDHIIPLNGENISGLHVIENLQYLPAVENIKKGNKIDLGSLNRKETA